jgi:hypothetical protein
MIGDRWYPGRLTELSTEECYELLASRPVGRIAFVVGDSPIVLPVNHTVDGDDIVFRTSPRTELGRRMIRGRVAFEVDDFDEFNQSGWSVLFQGSVEYDDSDVPWPEDQSRPWAEGVRNLVVRIRPRLVTGRRLMGV